MRGGFGYQPNLSLGTPSPPHTPEGPSGNRRRVNLRINDQSIAPINWLFCGKKKEPSWEICLVIPWNLVTVWMDEGRMAGGQFGSLTEIGISTVPLHLVQIFCRNHWYRNILWSHYKDFVSKAKSIKTSKNTFFEVETEELLGNFLLLTKLRL